MLWCYCRFKNKQNLHSQQKPTSCGIRCLHCVNFLEADLNRFINRYSEKTSIKPNPKWKDLIPYHFLLKPCPKEVMTLNWLYPDYTEFCVKIKSCLTPCLGRDITSNSVRGSLQARVIVSVRPFPELYGTGVWLYILLEMVDGWCHSVWKYFIVGFCLHLYHHFNPDSPTAGVASPFRRTSRFRELY